MEIIIKRIGFVCFFLLWFSTLLAKTIQLDQEVKIKIPENYEYLQFDQLKFMRANLEEVEVSKSEIDEIIDQLHLLLGMNGTETSTIIGRKGYKDSYGDFIYHVLSGKNPETWSGFDKMLTKCGNKKTEKSQMNCLINFFKMDPLIQIDVSNGRNDDFKELAIALGKANVGGSEDFESFDFMTEKVKNTFSIAYQNEIKTKIVKVQNKYWGIEILGEDRMMGLTSKRIGYIFFHNGYVFITQGFCMSKKTCQNIKKLNDKIIEPYLAMKLQKDKTSIKVDSNNNLIQKIKELSDLYKSGKMTEEEYINAKKKLLN